MIRPFGLRLICLAGSAFCLEAQSGCSAHESGDDVPVGGLDGSEVRHALRGADRVLDFSLSTTPAGNERIARFRSLGRSFTLHLVPNDELFAKDLTVVRDGVTLTRQAAGLDAPFRGFVGGDAHSWVRVRLRNGTIEGIVFHDRELYEIRPLEEGSAQFGMGRVSFGDYFANPSGKEAYCGVTESGPSAGLHDENRVEQQGCTWIGIHLIADYTYAAKTGGPSGAEREMAARMNEVDGLYRAELNHGFRIEKVTSHGTEGGPAYNGPGRLVPAVQLQQISEWKRQNEPTRGLVHLFAGRVVQGEVGRAWIASVCQAANGSGVSNYLGANRASTINPAHELGHNFGANHDSPGTPYVMTPQINPRATGFSDASKNAVRIAVGSRASCFSPCGSAGTGASSGSGGSGAGGSGAESGSGGLGGTGGSGGLGGGGGLGGSGGSGGSGAAGSGATGGSGAASGVDAGGGNGGVAGSAGAGTASGGISGSGTSGTGPGASAGQSGSGSGGARPYPSGPSTNESQSGCACRTAEPRPDLTPIGLLLGVGLLAGIKRRRQRS